MLCKEFEALTPKERTEFIGEIVHACMNDSQLFAKGDAIRKAGRMRGLFDGVLINPPTRPDNNQRGEPGETNYF